MMGFGEHATKTYGFVKVCKPSYAYWAMSEARKDPESSQELKRFAGFCEATMEPKTEPKVEPKEESRAPASKTAVKKETAAAAAEETYDYKKMGTDNPFRRIDRSQPQPPWVTQESQRPQPWPMAAAVPAGNNSDEEELVRDVPPQWDGNDDTLAEYIMRTKAYKTMEKIKKEAPASSATSSQAGRSWTNVNGMDDTTSKRKP